MKNFVSKNQKTGELGEDIAVRFLMKHGYEILERNYTRKWGELDIVAIKDNVYYFVEVKSVIVPPDVLNEKSSGTFFRPEENMHHYKIIRLRKIIETFLLSRRLGGVEWHLNLLLVYIDIINKKARVRTVDNIIV